MPTLNRQPAGVEDPRLPLALELPGALSVKTLASLSEVHVTGDGLIAYTRDGISISLGGDSQMDERARVLEGLLDQIQTRRLSVAHIDLRHAKARFSGTKDDPREEESPGDRGI